MDNLLIVASARPKLARRLLDVLGSTPYSARQCTRVDEMRNWLEEASLIVLDPDLPPDGGLAACNAVRAVSMVPVLIGGRPLSEVEQIAYLDQGADDVLRWPIGDQELLARIRAQLRRRSMQPPLRLVPLGSSRVFDMDNGLIVVDGHLYALTPTEARLMRALASRLGRPYPARELVETVWGRAYLASATTDILRANIYRLRRKLELDPRDPRLLRFVSGQGWVLGQGGLSSGEGRVTSAEPAAQRVVP